MNSCRRRPPRTVCSHTAAAFRGWHENVQRSTFRGRCRKQSFGAAEISGTTCKCKATNTTTDTTTELVTQALNITLAPCSGTRGPFTFWSCLLVLLETGRVVVRRHTKHFVNPTTSLLNIGVRTVSLDRVRASLAPIIGGRQNLLQARIWLRARCRRGDALDGTWQWGPRGPVIEHPLDQVRGRVAQTLVVLSPPLAAGFNVRAPPSTTVPVADFGTAPTPFRQVGGVSGTSGRPSTACDRQWLAGL